MDTSPEGIRALRGDRSVAHFAQLLGVSPLTVYRWELPERAAQSRRPRRSSRERLRALAAEELEASAAAAPDQGLVADLDNALGAARWDEARERALAALAGGEDPVLPQLAFAAAALLGRGDSRAALAALAPALRPVLAGRAHPELSARTCALAALIYAMPDGRTFDPGKVREAATRVAEYPSEDADSAALAAVAELQAAWFGADAALFEWTLSKRAATLTGARHPVTRALVLELRAAHAYLDGHPGEALRRFTLAAEEARALSFGLLEARALAMRALLELEVGTPPEQALRLLRRARRARAASRLEPGQVDLLIAAFEAEALLRRGLAADARSTCQEADRVAEAIRWLPTETLHCRTRMTFDTEGQQGVQRLLRWFEERAGWQASPEAPLHFLRGLEASFRNDTEAALTGMRAAAELCDGTRPWLKRMARLLVLSYTTYARPEEAEAAERGVERCLERYPSAWSRGLAAHHKGILATRRGEHALAREQLQTASATLEMAGDVFESARCTRALAIAAWIRQDPNATELLARSEAELERLGITPSPAQRIENIQQAAGSGPQIARPPLPLIIPVQRLAVRGLSTEQLRRELLATAKGLSESAVSLWDPGPPEVLLDRLGASTQPEGFSLELTDGMGRHYRLGLAGTPDPQTRSLLRALTAVASMALERAALYESGSDAEDSEPPEAPAGFVAEAPVSRALLADLNRLSRSRATVLITGESGTGKEVAARALHELSSRSEGPFIAFNCASVPRDLFDAQLFGYRRGAFTGARDSRPGMIRAADGGTLFLDEVGELPLEAQAKLLRFLENREVQPLGADRPVKVDVRVVAATHRDLRGMVGERRFREDLLYRLRVIPLHLPPLRERREDILPLARHFLSKLGGARLSPDAAAALRSHPWPGNVRQLRNVLERSIAYAPGGPIHAPLLRFDT